MRNPILIKGLVFPSRNILKYAIKQYGRINRVVTKLTRNDKLRVKAVCVPSCPWTLWASKLNPNDPMDGSLQIKILVNHHKCGKVMKNKNITSKWMARHYLHKFQVDPNYSLTFLRNDIRVDFGTIVSRTKCMRAKIRPLELVQGNHKAQYANIYDYLLELRRSNLGTTTICKLDCRLFQRLYICLEACKSGWLTGCRRIIGLDGCWLKGYYGGHLLATIGVDVNDCIYPVAFAVVENENKQSWFLFLELLQRDLEIDNSYNICFMSDKQKGSIEAISLLFPNGESRNCARHLYNNFKNIEGFKGQDMRLTYWKAAKVTFPRQFEEAMSEMRSLSESAEAWLRDKDLRTWSRAHFSTRCKFDLLLNNNNECFNKDLLSLQIILEARDKPILTMLEIIRRKVMTRLVFMREAAEKYPGPLCPRIQNKLSEIVSQSNNIWPIYAGNEKYEVDCGLGNKHVVDLLNSSCSCRKWDLSGIPCKHVVSCMQLLAVSPETYVNACYTVTTQFNIYSYLINPIKGPMQWEHVRDMEPILPTIIRRSPGRPKQTRRKEVDEVRKSGPKLSKIGQQANCTKFGKPSHNTRTCKGIVWGNQMASQSSSLQILNQATSMDNTSSQPPLTQQSSNLTINFRAKLPFKRKYVL
ncbi:hypothetical protein PVK06_024438 [Gossypium arboreum]|uniref:SWIM-type domain-containing protein n=1 Tax=Gossypium arboreum TaxID=29729 RepID=A0ABR0PDV7_GOSAR|nr:hypothetical protein PVK06_024438 [Gossypium arboreum]